MSRLPEVNRVIFVNNFPWPAVTSVNKATSTIEVAAQAILDSRALYPESILADMYDPLSMPQELLKAHAALDKAFDVAHSYKNSNDDTERETFLFELRQQITSLLSTTPVKKTRKNVVV